MGSVGSPQTVRFPSRTFSVPRGWGVLSGVAVVAMCGSITYRMAQSAHAGDQAVSPGSVFPYVLLLGLGIVALLIGLVAPLDGFRVGDESIDILEGTKVKRTLRYSEMAEIEWSPRRELWGSSYWTLYAPDGRSMDVPDIGCRYPNKRLIYAMLAERVPQNLVPPRWHDELERLSRIASATAR